MLGVLEARQSFGEDVGGIFLRATVRDEDGAVGDALADEVMTYVDVLRASVELMILGKSDSGEIIGRDDGGRISAKVEFSEESAEPNSFFGKIGRAHV